MEIVGLYRLGHATIFAHTARNPRGTFHSSEKQPRCLRMWRREKRVPLVRLLWEHNASPETQPANYSHGPSPITTSISISTPDRSSQALWFANYTCKLRYLLRLTIWLTRCQGAGCSRSLTKTLGPGRRSSGKFPSCQPRSGSIRLNGTCTSYHCFLLTFPFTIL